MEANLSGTTFLGLALQMPGMEAPDMTVGQWMVTIWEDGGFMMWPLAAALVVNFAVVPLVVAAMFTFLPADQAVRLGVLLVAR
jgi:hypothetical protein